jgi:hypothetical protein
MGRPAATDSPRLKINPSATGNTIAADFTGLSYESAQLGDPTFFSGTNTQLAGLVRRLGKSGVLRVGGNTSEYCFWNPDATVGATPQEPVGPDKGRKPAEARQITKLAVRNLRDFIDATGWELIYGLNLGKGTAEAAADEAAYVSQLMGEKLIAFQLCNEPDLFSRNGVRKAGYNSRDFAKEWQHFYEVIRQRVPNAPFAGPDTAFNNDWLVPFAKQFKSEVKFLSQHYYAEGPPENPAMTIERLLRPNPRLEAEFAGMRETHQDTGLPFRLAETNSCYSGGKEGVSNTFASALWGAELMYQLAQAGGIGINFHGGGFGWYTPIAGTLQKGFSARPLYYGMLLFEQAGPGTLIESSFEQPRPDAQLAAYSLRAGGGAVKTAIFNKYPDRAVTLIIEPGMRVGRASVLELSGPSLEATAGVTLGGAAVSDHGEWRPKRQPTLRASSGGFTLELPAASGALVTFS